MRIHTACCCVAAACVVQSTQYCDNCVTETSLVVVSEGGWARRCGAARRGGGGGSALGGEGRGTAAPSALSRHRDVSRGGVGCVILTALVFVLGGAVQVSPSVGVNLILICLYWAYIIEHLMLTSVLIHL